MNEYELARAVRKLNIPFFRGIFARNELPSVHTRKYETGIVNLGTRSSGGTHWCAYFKNGRLVSYFDPLGDIPPPYELKLYFSDCQVFYNWRRYQDMNARNCGQLVLDFLRRETSDVSLPRDVQQKRA